MKLLSKKFWYDSYVKGVVLVTFGLAITQLIPKIREATIKSIKWLFSEKLEAFPIWVFIFILALLVYAARLQYLRNKRDRKWQNKPKLWDNYKEGNFDGVLWRWRYDTRFDEPEIIGLKQFCQECDAEVVSSFCPTCRKKIGFLDNNWEDRVISRIESKIRKGDY